MGRTAAVTKATQDPRSCRPRHSASSSSMRYASVSPASRGGRAPCVSVVDLLAGRVGQYSMGQ